MVSSNDGLDDLLASTSTAVILVIGPGGVGKTTLAAAMACRAVERHERRVLLMTVDPARRLADALGGAELASEPVLVPVGDGAGRLWALVVDMATSWDALVAGCSENDDEEAALLRNPLYRSLTTRFVQSHNYIALDQLCDLADSDRYDLVVIDTPPSTHAIDILDAPDKMLEFFDGRLLRWLTAPYRSRLAYVAAKPFLALAERLLGGGFLSRIAEFFWLFSRLQPGFVARVGALRDRLGDSGTHYVLATTSEPPTLAQTVGLLEALDARHHRPALLLHNRAAPPVVADDVQALERIVDPSLRAAMASIIRLGRRLDGWWAAAGHDPRRLVPVPWRPGPLSTVAELSRMFD